VDETVRCGTGGTDYEIDLSAKNARALWRQRVRCSPASIIVTVPSLLT
jgi:hypothetical protein